MCGGTIGSQDEEPRFFILTGSLAKRCRKMCNRPLEVKLVSSKFSGCNCIFVAVVLFVAAIVETIAIVCLEGLSIR